MRAAAILVPLAGVIPKVASFAERRSNPMTRETGHPSDEMMPLADVVLRGISPAVTAAPKPRYVGANLFGRDDESNTCGYLHYYDDPNDDVYPLTCDPAYICTNVGSMRDCCRSSRCASATFSTSCLDSTACPAGGPDTGTFCCTSTQYPYCVSYLWSTSTNTDEIFTLLNCRVDTSSRLGTLEAQSTPLITSTPTTTTRPTTTSPITTTTSPVPDNKSGGTPVGAIVGGVVGGVAAIGLAGIAILFLVRKRKREASEASSPPPPQPTTHGSPPMQQQQQPYNPHQSYQSSQQPYNPHQSFYGHTPTSPDPTSIYPSPTQSPGPFQPYNPANGPATSPNPQYSIQPTPQGYVAQPYNEPGKTGPDVHTMNADPTPSPEVPSSTSPGATGGFHPPQHVHTVQQPGQYVEAPAINPVGSTENRAELG